MHPAHIECGDLRVSDGGLGARIEAPDEFVVLCGEVGEYLVTHQLRHVDAALNLSACDAGGRVFGVVDVLWW